MRYRSEYPRPQFQRRDWLALNGVWEFAFDDGDEGIEKRYETGNVALPLRINVPFTFEYEASGIGERARHERVWYRRRFAFAGGKRALLCFNGSDYRTDVWVNGVHAVCHTGGFSPFSAEITELLRVGENVLVVRCFDPCDPAVPRGKQSWTGKPFGCWYWPNTGIWQSVWIDFFGEDCISAYRLTPDHDDRSVWCEIETLRGEAEEGELEISFGGEPVAKARFSVKGGKACCEVPLNGISPGDERYTWSPEHPNLFSAVLRLYRGGEMADEAKTRFGLRKIAREGDRILLNGQPFYQRLVLDQGYWPESGITPPSAEALKRDIELAMRMGFNGARKHQKFEDPYFYYYAEELGFVVWCEMPSAYQFCAEETERIAAEWSEIVSVARNFTSVICYVPLNESWGVGDILSDEKEQNFARALYRLTKSLDGTRLVSVNDGWEYVETTDLLGIHDYAYSSKDFAEKYRKDAYDALFPQDRKLMCELCRYGGQPVLMTEFGGIALDRDTLGENWGYNDGAKSAEEFFQRYEDLIRGILQHPEFRGFCYTQLTDVQQEVNGLLFPDRTPKFDLSRLFAITAGKEKK